MRTCTHTLLQASPILQNRPSLPIAFRSKILGVIHTVFALRRKVESRKVATTLSLPIFGHRGRSLHRQEQKRKHLKWNNKYHCVHSDTLSGGINSVLYKGIITRLQPHLFAQSPHPQRPGLHWSHAREPGPYRRLPVHEQPHPRRPGHRRLPPSRVSAPQVRPGELWGRSSHQTPAQAKRGECRTCSRRGQLMVRFCRVGKAGTFEKLVVAHISHLGM